MESTEEANGKVSLSYARDFFSPCTSKGSAKQAVGAMANKDCDATMTNVDGFYASRDFCEGAVVLTESELPDCSLPR